jgi:ribose transport system substrate-binding protein
MFSFNTNGAIMAAQQGLKAKIPVVLTDDVGHALSKGVKVAATVDFDWCGMGKAYGRWIAAHYPKQGYAILAGNFQAPPTQILDKCLMQTAKQLGNPLAAIRETSYSPEKAVNLATDLVQSGKQFKVMFVMDEDMAASVARMLKAKGLLNTKIVLIAQNGSPVGMQMLKEGSLKYTISSSPGWEGQVAFLALYRAATGGASATASTRFNLPVIPITKTNVNDKTKVVPWEPNPVYGTLTKQYFPQLVPGK